MAPHQQRCTFSRVGMIFQSLAISFDIEHFVANHPQDHLLIEHEHGGRPHRLPTNHQALRQHPLLLSAANPDGRSRPRRRPRPHRLLPLAHHKLARKSHHGKPLARPRFRRRADLARLRNRTITGFEPDLLSGTDLAQIASIVSRLEYLRLPDNAWDAVLVNSHTEISPAMQYWAPASYYSAGEITITSLPRLEFIQFPYLGDEAPKLSGPFMHMLASLRPPLRYVSLIGSHLPSEDLLANLLAACPTIEDLNLIICRNLTNETLTALQTHPPLHRLSPSHQ
ncbi:hypothetical protein BDK51DRAFT_38376 [Blyttiomyces helicus]|uniref:F-box domain-containing protein n=1 Tax=Blyttiomyces helicus TaxID=388810 RepID=A0A4P9W4T7_9FUNG|nr:hypothetical protein BDK51DRAFT_38376 [Blyttiomyces helicus]|eukprot:RKO87369.1 hypothetical protein BDK51DRAFT_38376 [Blyttiomyces helicus]